MSWRGFSLMMVGAAFGPWVLVVAQKQVIQDQQALMEELKQLRSEVLFERLESCELRLREVDCSAPLIPGAPFHGLGLYRAVNCGQGPYQHDGGCRCSP